jgi:hypothetical protein
VTGLAPLVRSWPLLCRIWINIQQEAATIEVVGGGTAARYGEAGLRCGGNGQKEGRGGGSRQSVLWFHDDTMNMGTALTASSRNCSMEECVMCGKTGKRRVPREKKKEITVNSLSI